MDEQSHLAAWAVELAHFLRDWWFIISGVILITVGSIWWSLHRWFVTHENMALCKEDLATLLKSHEVREFSRQDEIAKKHDEYRVENALHHAEISSKVERNHETTLSRIDALTREVIANMRMKDK